MEDEQYNNCSDLIVGAFLIHITRSFCHSSASSNRVVVCNIHVLFNPRRGDIKLGQVQLLSLSGSG